MISEYSKLCFLKNMNKSLFKNLNCTTQIHHESFSETYNSFLGTIGIYVFVLFILTIPIALLYNCCNKNSNKNKNKNKYENKTMEETEDNTELSSEDKNSINNTECNDCESNSSNSDSETKLSNSIFLSNKELNKIKQNNTSMRVDAITGSVLLDKEKILNILYNVISTNNILTIKNINKLINSVKTNNKMKHAYKKANELYKTFDNKTKMLSVYKNIVNKITNAKINIVKVDNVIILFMTIIISKIYNI